MNTKSLFVPIMMIALIGTSPALADTPPAFSFAWGGTTQYAGVRLNDPRGIARGPAGVLYVSDTDNRRVLKFSSAGVFLQQIPLDFLFPVPSGLDVDAAGNLYVACTASNLIAKYSPTGTFLASYGSGGTGPLQFNNPYAVAVDGLGFIYVGDKDNDRIQKLNPDGTYHSEWNGATVGTGTFRPIYMKFSSTGFLYVTDGPGSRVLAFTPSGSLANEYSVQDGCSGSPRNTSGIAVDPSGGFFVGHPFLSCIQQYTSHGSFRSSWGSFGTAPGQFDLPNDMELSEDGSILYVVDRDNNRIQAFVQEAPTPVRTTTWSAIKTRIE